MKKFDMSKIKLSKPVKDKDGEKDMDIVPIIKTTIENMVSSGINGKPDPRTGRSNGVSMEVQRKYFKSMNALDSHKKGNVEMEDDDFSFLCKYYNKAEVPVGKDVSEIVVKISLMLDKAKNAGIENEDKK